MRRYQHLFTFLISLVATFAVLTFFYFYTLPEPPLELEGGLLSEEDRASNQDPLVPSQYILNTGIDLSEIPPIIKPVYRSVLASDAYLNDNSSGVVLQVDGVAHYYPIQILNYHYVLNDVDSLGGFAVTYCTFCESPVAYRTDRTLRASGFVYNNNMLLVDEEGNRWSQIAGVAVEGQDVGESLERITDVEVMTWSAFKDIFPGGRVLSPNTGLSVEYGVHPFGAYPSNDTVYYPVNHRNMDIDLKERVAGFELNGARYAVPLESEEDYYFSGEFAAIYQNGRLVGINKTDVMTEIDLLVDSRYEPIPYTESFAMCWFGMYPDTEFVN